jgi:glycosyltransferase involved in cell wall biosynthesis
MGKPLKIIIVGLPLFAERLAKTLSQFDPKNRYTFLNTYYSKKDKLKARFLIPRADLLFSINGSIVSSGVFDLAMRKKVPIIMNWVGTDVLLATEAFTSGNYRKDYIQYAKHFCEVGWIQDELSEIGIDAQIVNFASFDKRFEMKGPTSERYTVLTYIPKVRSEFYQPEIFLNVAKRFPEVDFLIAGTDASEYEPLPENVKALGWVSDMDAVYEKVHACVRIPEHDGLSTFILEGLARGKDVFYKYQFDHCQQAENEEDLTQGIKPRLEVFNSGNWQPNTSGAEFIEQTFNRKKILGELTEHMQQLIQKGN